MAEEHEHPWKKPEMVLVHELDRKGHYRRRRTCFACGETEEWVPDNEAYKPVDLGCVPAANGGFCCSAEDGSFRCLTVEGFLEIDCYDTPEPGVVTRFTSENSYKTPVREEVFTSKPPDEPVSGSMYPVGEVKKAILRGLGIESPEEIPFPDLRAQVEALLSMSNEEAGRRYREMQAEEIKKYDTVGLDENGRIMLRNEDGQFTSPPASFKKSADLLAVFQEHRT